CGARVHVRRQDPQVVAILEERLHERRGMLVQPLARGRGGLDGAIVDVGEVHDVNDVVARGAEIAAQQVLEQEGAEVADVRVVPDGRTARIEGDAGRRERCERLDAAAERVVERSEEHTSELQSLAYLVCRLLLEKKKNKKQ